MYAYCVCWDVGGHYFWTMRSFLIVGTILLSTNAIGQSLNQNDLVEIFKLAFKQNKLPSELVPKLDKLFQGSVPEQFIVIKADQKFAIKRNYDDNADTVMVWAAEEIFLYDIPYWVTLLESSRKKDKALIKYETTTFGTRPGAVTTCYKGEIKSSFNRNKWTLLKSKFTEADCNFRHWSGEEK
jgi:hypothetical protein